MSIHIIIDGYNLIRQSRRLSDLDLQDIQLGRDTLIDMLAAYKKIKTHRITVVFDGARSALVSQRRDRQKGITIVFSHNSESADTVIKRMARKEGERALVVTSDMDIVRSVQNAGAAVISAPEFESKLELAFYAGGMDIDRDAYVGWKPTTKKKGPGRRLPKKKRKNKVKIRKL